MGSNPILPLQITVVTFLWGDWFGLGEEYLLKLKSGISRNTFHPLRFICLADESATATWGGNVSGWKFLPLQAPSYLKNLRKLGLYNPANGFHGRLFVVDLDIVIVGSLDDIFSYSGEFCIKGIHRHENPKIPYQPDGDIFLQNVNPDRWARIWAWINRRIPRIEYRTFGRERTFYEKYGRELWPEIECFQERFPGQVVSFKRDRIKKTQTIPENARIVSFHGKKVKPHMVPWMGEYWK